MAKKFWDIKNQADAEQAEMLIYGDIADETWWGDETTPKQFAEDLAALGGKDLTLRINSPGGDVFAAHAVYNQLKAYSGKVTARIDGLCASAATIITCAATHVVMPDNAVFMIHNPAIGLVGYYGADEAKKIADYLSTVKDTILAVYQGRVGDAVSRTKLVHMMDSETWMSASEALECGFVDEVDSLARIENSIDGTMVTINSVSLDMSKYTNTAHLQEILVKKTQKSIPKGEENVENDKVLDKIKDLLGLNQQAENNTGKEDAVQAERQRIVDLDAAKTGNKAADAIIDVAKKNGQTIDDIKPYLDAMPKADNENTLDAIKALIADHMESGAQNVAPQPHQDKAADEAGKRQAAIDEVVKFANAGKEI